ncbi:MAG: bifunctional demethylmenaquinone methyltransferase/2-methoxy-6-polyprenyl-1,4-benzoquinol methylase UbiE [Planctomycetota bacterium]|nr:MAG: bifunctional demethylmenaquinone methyltransferase/2-methoxy-6-polyprenyl-1,4-benzoquinol methylase UbiE [Planctomycetota bacterium]
MPEAQPVRQDPNLPSGEPLDKSGARVRSMFAQIAPRYDLLNHLLSLGIDVYWRRRAMNRLRLDKSTPVLDCCTGTGDLALMIARRLDGRAEVVGTDFCEEMLQIARTKHARKFAALPVRFETADTMHLPFDDGSFQAVTVAFGLRNVQDTLQGLHELVRVCEPGGQVCVLEFSKPTLPGFRHVYNFYFRAVLPRVGQWLARNEKGAYNYLPASVQAFPCGEQLVQLMEQSGLTDVRAYPLTFGVATIYIGNRLEHKQP